jgi:hypothetical protein
VVLAGVVGAELEAAAVTVAVTMDVTVTGGAVTGGAVTVTGATTGNGHDNVLSVIVHATSVDVAAP